MGYNDRRTRNRHTSPAILTGVDTGMWESLRGRLAAKTQGREHFVAAGLLILLGLLAYFTFAGELGFYRDDWYVLWAGRTVGPTSIIDLFAFDRPFVGYVYSLTYSILGENALLWQSYSLCVRAIGALAFLWLLRRIWPRQKLETTTAAVLMFLYPGFLQWTNAMTKSNHLTTYTLALVSIALTAAALSSDRRILKIALSAFAIVTAVAYWFLYEYMIGLEALRLMVIGLLVWRWDLETKREKAGAIARVWMPYFVFTAAHVLWRLLFFESGRQGMKVDVALSLYQAAPLRAIAKRLIELVIDCYESVISAWAVPINSVTFGLERGELLPVLAVSLASVGLFTAYLVTFAKPASAGTDPDIHKHAGLEMILTGAVAVVFALAPVIAVGRDVRWSSGFDKYTLQASAGVAMLLVGAFVLLGRSGKRWILPALLVGIATATHTGNALQWGEFWEHQRELWWQLSWRAPQLEDDTVVLVEMPGKDFFEAYELWGPANIVYRPQVKTLQLSGEVFSQETLERLRVGARESRGVRSVFDLERDFHKSLILSRPTRSSCWHVLDGDDPVLPEPTSGLLYAAVRRSHIEQIKVAGPASVPPETIFGLEPDHRWCYYFQKASLAAQRGEWERVAQLADQALDADLKPLDRSEWMPFMRGYVMTGREAEAEEMSLWIRDVGVVRHRQCDYMSETSLPDPERRAYLRELLCD